MNSAGHANFKLVTHMKRYHVLCLHTLNVCDCHLNFFATFSSSVYCARSSPEVHKRDRDIRSQSMPLTAGISSWRRSSTSLAFENHWGWRGSVSELYVFSFIVCVCLRAARPLLSRGTGRVPQELSQVHRVSRIPAQEILIQIINGSMKNMIQQHLHISCYEALITVKHWPSHTII